MFYCKFRFSDLEFIKAQKKLKRAGCKVGKYQRLHKQKIKANGSKQMDLGLQSIAWARCKPPTSKSMVHKASAV